MLKIGEFSKIAQVSIKTLRYYDRMGLLKPAHIDRFSGYRYYALSQLVRLNRILALKDLDFTLDQVRELLEVDLSSDVLQHMLQNKADELRQRLMDEQSRLARVENRLLNLQEAHYPDISPVVLKSAPHRLVATVRQVVPSIHMMNEWQRSQIEQIKGYLNQLNQPASGPDILIYHHEEYRETDLDVEVGTILKETRNVAEKGPEEGPIRIHTLFGVNQLATTITTRSASTLPETYAKLTSWTQINGFRPIGPWRELTFEPDDPAGVQVIEVQRPVMKANKFYTQMEITKMEPKIIKKEDFTIVGLRYFGKNEHNEIPELWNQFNKRMEEMGGLEHETGEAAVGLCITPDDEPMEGAFEYVAGALVDEVEDVPEDFVVRHVPEQTYAVFEHKGDMPSLSKTYEYIYETWLPQSGFQVSSRMDFEYYNEDFKNFAPDSIFYIYIPIEKAE